MKLFGFKKNLRNICVVSNLKKNMEGKKRILVAHGAKKQLMAALGTSYPTVRAALRYDSDTEISRRIRYVAITQFAGIRVMF